MNLEKLIAALQYCFPQHGVSRLVGKFAAAEAGWLTTAFIRWFAKRYGVDMSEAQESDAGAYPTFNQFFTRPLKPGLRPIAEGEQVLAHPVDGAVSQLGKIEHGRLFQAKGHWFSSEELLGGDPALAAEFDAGEFATIYLSPKDYHRLHMPIAGTLRKMIYVPGQLFSVNQLTVRNVPNLFARNERVVAIFDTAIGPMAMVLVGATIVASIETVWAGTVTPPTGRDVFSWTYPTKGDEALHLDKGDEMGRFKLGSTVVLLFGKDAMAFDPDLKPDQVTRMGTAMGRVLGSEPDTPAAVEPVADAAPPASSTELPQAPLSAASEPASVSEQRGAAAQAAAPEVEKTPGAATETEHPSDKA